MEDPSEVKEEEAEEVEEAEEGIIVVPLEEFVDLTPSFGLLRICAFTDGEDVDDDVDEEVAEDLRERLFQDAADADALLEVVEETRW